MNPCDFLTVYHFINSGASTYLDEFLVALAALVSDTGQVRVALLAVFTNNQTVVVRVLSVQHNGNNKITF